MMKISNCCRAWAPWLGSLTASLLLTALVVSAAEPETKTPSTNAPSGRVGPAPIVSPEVHPDRTVTFRLRALKAKDVSVNGEFGKYSLTNDGNGVWSATIGPLAPDLYGYGFSVDDLAMIDPVNSWIKPMRSPTTSVLEVPGEQTRLYDFLPEVPHGSVRLHSYLSKSLQTVRRLQVYTPPGYDKGGKFPVLYLFHGSGDNEGTWTALGRAQFIADNLLAQKKAKPMVIVMTDGHAVIEPRPAAGGTGRNRNTEAFQRDLFEEVMPLVENNYRLRSGRENRAIIGLSMGGGQSLTIGLNHLDKFAWVGGMSSAVRNPETNLVTFFANPTAANKSLKLLWFGCGKDDFLLKENQHFDALLTEHGIKHEFKLSEGNHSWPVWRRYLVEFMPRLFAK